MCHKSKLIAPYDIVVRLQPRDTVDVRISFLSSTHTHRPQLVTCKESSRGVAIYMKDTLSPTLNLDLTDHLFSESVWVNIHINDKDNFLIGGVYRSPQSSIENSDLLLDLLQKTKDTTYSNILIMGDFNPPEINWDLWTTTRSENHISYKFLECFRDIFWEQAW